MLYIYNMSDEKVDTSTAAGNVIITWIKYTIFFIISARLGAGNTARFVNWKDSMKQKDDLDRMPYSAPGKTFGSNKQSGGGNFAAKMAERAAKAAIEKKKKSMMEKMKKAATGMSNVVAGKSNITESSGGKHDLPYSLIGGDVITDWIGRNIAFSFATQRKLFNKYFEYLGKMVYGNNWKGGKSDLHLYVLNLGNIFFLSWVFFWLLFFGHMLFGNLITIWGASIFGGYFSGSWGKWDPFDFDFSMQGGTMKLIFHTLFCLIPLLIFFCLELPIIGVVQPIMLLIWFWFTSYYEGGGAKYHWKLFWKYPRVIFYLLCVLFIMSSVLELSGDHLQDPRSAQSVMYPFIIVPMILILIVEYIHRYDRAKK